MDNTYILSRSEELAFFMGARRSVQFDGADALIIPGKGLIVKGAQGTRYHTSWSWLIPVWVKFVAAIQELGLDKHDPVAATIEIFNHHVARGEVQDCYKTLAEAVMYHKSKGNLTYGPEHV